MKEKKDFNKGSEPTKGQSNIWEEKKRSILEGLEKKLETARSFSGIIESLQNGKLNNQEAEKLIVQLKEKMKQEVSPDVLAKYHEIMEIREKLTILSDELYKLMREIRTKAEAGNQVDYNDLDSDEKMQQIDKLREKISEIMESHQDLDFLVTMVGALNYIQKALIKVEGYKKDSDLILKDLAEARKVDYKTLKSSLKIKRVIFSPISVNLILDKGESFKPLYSQEGGQFFDEKEDEDTLGLHTSESECNINVIKEGDNKEVEETIKHENVHILEDSFSEYIFSAGPPIGTFKSLTNLIPKALQQDNLERITKDKTGRYKATQMLDLSHGEILAALGQSPKLIEYLKSTQLRAIFSGDEPKPISSTQYVQVIQLLSTAGNQISEMYSVLKECEKSKNQQISKICKEEGFHYIKKFARSMGSLGYAYLFVPINNLGVEADTDIRLLTYLLKPSQYHHIPMFLKYKYETK